MILKWKEFITEKLSQNEVLDLYNHFIRILKIHEDFFHHDTKISNDSNFKGDINKVFHKLMIGKKPFTEELFNLVGDYEKRLYGEVKIAPEESYGCSMWDVFDIAKEKYKSEIDIIDFAIDILTSYKEEYPHLAEELEDKIEIWKKFKEERL